MSTAFFPLENSFKANVGGNYEIFDQWIETLTTDQIVSVEVKYDPRTGRQIQGRAIVVCDPKPIEPVTSPSPEIKPPEPIAPLEPDGGIKGIEGAAPAPGARAAMVRSTRASGLR
jgi:hypothetical protein